MQLLVLDHDQIEGLLSLEACMSVVAEALTAVARGDGHQPLRSVMAAEGAGGLLGLMPAYVAGATPAFGVKLIAVFPGNRPRGLDSHQGAVVLLSPETGEPLALMDASAVTAWRTAAASALATRALAREDAGDLALIGAGVQAAYHLEAMAAVRALRRVRMASRSGETARRFADEHQPRFTFPIEAVENVEEAVRDADLVVTVTTAVEPVLKAEWLSAGAHLNVIGGPGCREVDDQTMARAALFVDSCEAAENESGEYRSALAAGAISPGHVRAELGEVLAGLRPGREKPDEITLFKSLGVAVEDVATAAHLYERAREEGVGTWVSM